MQAQRDIITSDFDKSTPYGDRRQVRAACPEAFPTQNQNRNVYLAARCHSLG